MRNAVTYDTIGNLLTEILYNAKGAIAEQNDLAIGRKTVYTYDESGRLLRTLQPGYSDISTMVQGGVTYTYTYDSLNQLTAVATSDNSYTAAFSYDSGGNLTSKTVNGQTYTYSYGDTEWKDLLTAYNGEAITYDQIGNPLNYRGKTLTWTGRRLDSLTQNGSTNTYLYNADGIRTQKTVNGTATEYFLNGSAILAEKTGDTVNWFIYDDSGDVLGLIHNGTAYYYLKNQQDDVLAIVDSSGTVVGQYTYDAWGKVLSVTGSIAQINPIRYRSYYYDTETGWYYLQSRYYDPEIGRFVSADDTDYLGASGTVRGYNLFAYCENNPVNYSDETGRFRITTGYIGWIGSLIIGVASLIFRIINIGRDIRSIRNLTKSRIATLIITALPYGSAYVTSEIISFLSSCAVATALAATSLSFVMACATGGMGTVIKTAISFVSTYFLPSIITSVQMIYYAYKYRRGCRLTFTWGGVSARF